MNVILNKSTMDQIIDMNKKSSEYLHDTIINQKKWEWGFLRHQCRNFELEQFYQSYMQRLRVSYLSLFILIQFIVMSVHSIILLSTISNLTLITVDIVAYIASALIAWAILALNFRDELIRRYPWIMYVTSWLAVTTLTLTDIGIGIYHAVKNLDILRPAYGSYILYAVYIFMPVPENLHAILLGLAVTISYLTSYAFITYHKHPHNDQMDVTKLITETIFLLSVNLLGVYFRIMREIAIRTTFLDRRQYVEENIMLRFARDEEKNLLLSIIPAQIANKIEQDVKGRVENIRNKKQQNQRFENNRNYNQHITIMKMKKKKKKRNIKDVNKDDCFSSTVMTQQSTGNLTKLRRWRQPDTEKLFIEPHDDVTILYADVVNYTYLTTTLDVKTLVETLHDLFVKFDIASEENDVLRIKFLGDCYYCVAGVPFPNEYHAKCCVDLGLRMIKDIGDVRFRRQLNIDMRIGVHSGSILSGVIGACKWQYDIWSKDVDIANRLEQTGVAGRVHVSEETLKQLDGEYIYEEGTTQARSDPVLKKYGIRSFLIKPPRYPSYGELKRPWLGGRSHADQRHKIDSCMNFMQNNIKRFNQIRNQAKLEMSRELDKMPIGRIKLTRYIFGQTKRLTQDELEEQNFRRNITSLCLFFKDWRWEKQFLREPDDMLKYSIILSIIIYLAIMAKQSINKKHSMEFWLANTVYITLMLICVFMSWLKKFWIIHYADYDKTEPDNKIILSLYNASDRLQSNLPARIIIYVLIILICCSATFMQLIDCKNHHTLDFHAVTTTETIRKFYKHTIICDENFNPWAITQSVELIICLIFLFSRIPFLFKLIIGFLLTGIYVIIIFIKYAQFYEMSPSSNVHLDAEYSHVLVIVITFVIFHLMDRQTEFITKVDYNWKRQLQKKQEDAEVTNESISVLINNILPSHVADIYISKEMRNELYYEEYDNVAVMFASIKNYDSENVGLRVLNEIICDFDDVLKRFEMKGAFKVEKIKVAGWTYMAACGLDLDRSDNIANTQKPFRNSSLLPNGRRSHYYNYNNSSCTVELNLEPSTSKEYLTEHKRSQAPIKIQYEGNLSDVNKGAGESMNSKCGRKISSPQQKSNVVYVMAQFALALMRTMHDFNIENLQCEDGNSDHGMLRIGISNGEIMAGVVGSSKPHYDIWGNAVNMASRMDSTGIPGKIQVTEGTANILRTFNIQCNYRGLTYVKGRGEIPTYLLGIDDNFKFIPENSNLNSNPNESDI